METLKRTHTCGSLTLSDKGKKVILNGWVHRYRNHGGIQFINLRDRYGITQIVIDSDAQESLKEMGRNLKFEYCLAVEGVVRPRPESMVNREMITGEIEVQAETLSILTSCDTLPFMIDETSDAKEDLRLKYRYLDLRSFSMQKKLKLRNDVTFAVREYLIQNDFLEIETPILIKSTPEGARDFLVPSRMQPGKFYALPQSPQLFKQILMVSGFDRYFQIARCFRDEDLRGDRQLEHTQIDMEMSFVSKEDVFKIIEGMLSYVFKKTLGIDIPLPFPRLSYQEAMDRYGSDKPDLRFDFSLQDFSSLAELGEFANFKETLKSGGVIKALVASGCADYSRKTISELEETARVYGAKGLAWIKVTEKGIEGGVSKFFESVKDRIIKELQAKPGDLILLLGDEWKTACTSLGAVRNKLGSLLSLKDKNLFRFTWVIDFPLFEWNQEENKWDPAHHMFTMPQERFLPTLEKDPGSVLGDLYDLVCNGLELASGSIRIHDPEIQKRIFSIVGFSQKQAEERFGFLLEAFKFGAPPHGGIAPGLDRLIMLMAGAESIREVIAFPKNTAGISPMDDSPSPVEDKQLKELHIELNLE